MQTITPVDVHIENEWRDGRISGSHVKRSTTTANREERQGSRMRTCVTNKTKPKKAKSCNIPQQVIRLKQALPSRSRTPSPNREPW
jgi:hypothetical protein